MIDLAKLDSYLSSEQAPENSMGLSELDGFLTGILCSPELIMPSEWLPFVWGSDEPDVEDIDSHIWAVQEVLKRHNDVAAGLNNDPAFIEPILWRAPEGYEIAMDWCEGFMDAFQLRTEMWDEFMTLTNGKDLLFPVLAHLFDEDGNSLIGAEQEILDKLLDKAADQIPEVIPEIFRFWKNRKDELNDNLTV